MGKIIGILVGLALCTACAAGRYPQAEPKAVVFDTGKSRREVMNAIVDVILDEGYTVASTSDADGTIVCNPRHMLDGVLTQKITGNDWGIQSKKATYNHLIDLSARVGQEGVVELKALVLVSGPGSPVDVDKSDKLARYYEKEILKALRRGSPRPLIRKTE